MTIRAHRDSVIASLQQDLPGAVFKSYSAVAGSLQRYAVVFIAPSTKRRPRYTGGQSRTVYTVTVHSVGLDEDLALWVHERVDRLTGRVLVVPGYELWPVEFVTSRPPELDDDSPTPLWFTVTQFDVISDPA